jgi:exopolysaccharide/PEP-CTERM locus tyrosine autokinase
MSRIEKALEKALKQRTAHGASGAAGSSSPPATQAGQEQKSKPRKPGVAPIEHPHLIANRKNYVSPVSEEYKKLKARVMKSTKQDPFRNLLLVTSTIGGEGKTITAANLALSLAQDYDHSVLLVDADTRKPSLHTLFNVKSGVGLTDCLVDGLDVGKALITVGTGNLSFLPSGRKMENPVELFGSHKMQKLLTEMKTRYADRYVVIDSPPALLFAETKILCTLVDGIIFVIREGRAPREHLDEALETIKAGQLLGVVYNGAEQDRPAGLSPYNSYYSRYYTDTASQSPDRAEAQSP